MEEEEQRAMGACIRRGKFPQTRCQNSFVGTVTSTQRPASVISSTIYPGTHTRNQVTKITYLGYFTGF